MFTMVEVMVLGAGVSGLSAAWHAAKAGLEAVIFEKEERYGGLLDHFMVEGFRFDKGVHFAFSGNEPFRKLLDQTKMHVHRPAPYNYGDGLWLKHPVQNNLYPLPAEEKVEAILSFIDRPAALNSEADDESSYLSWLEAQFGKLIAHRYPARYTKKYWTVPAQNLSTLWVGNRLYRPELKEVLLGALSEETPPVYYFKEMFYPQKGGFRAILEPLVKVAKINYGQKVTALDPVRREVTFAGGTKERYTHLVSSLPLPELVKMLPAVPAKVQEAAASLWATSTALVSLGLAGGAAGYNEHLWFYIYDEDILPARAHAPYLKAAENALKGCRSLQFEVYFSRHKKLALAGPALIEHVVGCAQNLGLLAKNEIIASDVRILPYTNVVFDRGMAKRRALVLDYVKSLKVVPVGRFGLWDYLWSDQCFLSGKIAEKLSTVV